MSAIEELAKQAAVPELWKPLGAMTRNERVALIVQAMNRAGQALHTRIPAPAWTLDPQQRTNIIESQSIIYEGIKERAQEAIDSLSIGQAILAPASALKMAGNVFADLLWAAFYSADYGLLPMIAAYDRGERSVDLDTEYLYRLAMFQAVYKIAESPIADPLAAQYNQNLSTKIIGPLLAPIELGWKAFCLQPWVLAAPPDACKQRALGDVSLATVAIIIVVSIALIAIIAFAVVHLYEVQAFNQRWEKTCVPMPADPEVREWCQKTGEPPPAFDPNRAIKEATKYGFILLGGYLVIKFLPTIVERIGTARRTAKERAA